jgi:hypothetical protein
MIFKVIEVPSNTHVNYKTNLLPVYILFRYILVFFSLILKFLLYKVSKLPFSVFFKEIGCLGKKKALVFLHVK